MAFSPAPNLTSEAFGLTVIKAAYDRYFEMALRHAPILRDLADKRPVQVDKPSSTVTLSLHADLTPISTTLTEANDVVPVSLPAATNVVITLAERGNAVVQHKLLREFSMTDVDPYVANAVAYNMRDSLDSQFQTVLVGGSNVRYSGTATTRLTTNNTDVISSNDVRYIVTKLRGNAAVPKREDLYGAYVHPDVSYNLKAETGAAAWRDPHNYTAPDNIWRHVIGVYEGAYFVESARMLKAADGEGTAPQATVYRSIFCGQQAMAEAEAVSPQLVVDGKVGSDLLSRLYTIGWYSVLGWARYREAALWRLESGSTINSASDET